MSTVTQGGPARLRAAHDERTGLGDAVLQRLRSGSHSPYRWLARAVSLRATRVLDAACGSGALTRLVATAGREVVSVDWRHGELDAAAAQGPGTWICADLRELPFPDESFDAVVSALGLAVVQPTDAFIAEAARVVRPGGVVAMMAPALVPLAPSDVAIRGRVGALLGARPLLSGVAHQAEIDAALSAHRLRRIEARRECYRFRVTDRDDAELIIDSLGLRPSAAARKERAVDFLVAEAERHGSVEVAVPLRRIVAIK